MSDNLKGLSDCHLHTAFSTDSNQSPEGTIQKAIELGLSSICITDHTDFDFPKEDPAGPEEFVFDTDEYFSALISLKEKYKNQIEINIGVELGLLPYLAERNNQFASSKPFDFIIGSSHLIDGADPYFPSFWEGKDGKAMVLKYFESILDNIKAYSNFDVYGHIDYINRYAVHGNYTYNEKDFTEIILEILKNLIDMGKGIEINSGTLAKGLPNPNPSASVVKMYKELHGEILTFGSDAHEAANVGFAFSQTKAIAQEAGFKYYAVFKNRKPEFRPL